MKLLLSEEIWTFDLAAALSEISDQRREQALKFKHEQGQRLCVLAYRLLQQALREEYAITASPVFEYAEHGKPAIVGHPGIHFNLSHCREAVACVVSSRPVGIDIESVRPYKDTLARYAMNSDELLQIQASDNPALAFTRLWTMKEATLKLTGQGITTDLKSVLDAAPYKYTTVEDARQRYVYTVCEPHKGSDPL